MKSLEFNAKTVDEAIRIALEQLNVSRDEIEVTILGEGKAGILGVGSEDAMIKVDMLEPEKPEITGEGDDIAEITRHTLENLLDLMGIEASVSIQTPSFLGNIESDTKPVVLNVRGDDSGILIGRRGQTLACIQYIVRLIVGHQTMTWLPIIIDIEGYKQRRYEALRVLAKRLAEQVKARKVPFTLEPMSPYERRIIHLALVDDPAVTTESTGDGDRRKVVINPVR